MSDSLVTHDAHDAWRFNLVASREQEKGPLLGGVRFCRAGMVSNWNRTAGPELLFPIVDTQPAGLLCLNETGIYAPGREAVLGVPHSYRFRH